MFSHLVRVAASAALPLLACAVPALAQQIIAVTFTTNMTAAETEAAGLSASGGTEGYTGMIINDLLNLIADDPAFQKCGARVVEFTRMADIQAERDFQHSIYAAPEGRSDPRDAMEPNRFVTGHISVTGSGVAWLVELAGPSGVVARITGEGTLGDLVDRTAEIARQLLEKACKPRAVHIEAGLNDLEIDEDVCDLTQPFTLSGRGASTGIVLEMTPATAEGGSFAVTGVAGGVTWSGGGQYQIAELGGQGIIGLDGTWSITSPMGVFSDSDTIPGTVTAIENCTE